MKKRAFKFLSVGLLGFVGAVDGADLNFSDDFESYAVGTTMNAQGGWVVTAGTAANTATVVSGGSGFDGGQGKAVLLDDNDSGGANARLGYVFSSSVTKGAFQFDYKPGSDVSQKPVVQVMGTKVGGGMAAGVYLLLDNSGTVQSFKAGEGFTNLGVSLAAGQWYRIVITVNDVDGSADTYNLEIKDTSSQTVASADGLSLANNLSDLKSLYFSFNDNGKSSEYYIDNVQSPPTAAKLSIVLISSRR